MARVLYGIHGTGHGHAMRGLTLARRLPEHEFLFVANDDAARVLEPEFRVHRLPNLGTVFKNYKVDVAATVARAVPLLLHRERYIGEALRLIDDFRPHACMTDLEYFVPRAAERAGLPCLTLDHQHIITSCRHDLPLNMRWDAFVQGLTPRWLFRPTSANLIISFYAPALLPQYAATTRIAPPILRERVLALTPRDEGHVLVYQSNSTHKKLIDILRAATTRTCYVYGYAREEGREGNVIFKRKSEEEFLELLASCAYVVQGGGHTLMSEALYLGKPVLSLPIRAMVEQRFNALYLERLGYGMQADLPSLTPDILRTFESQLDGYKNAIAQENFCGNELVFGLVDKFIRTGKLEMGEAEN
ncbi:glycosyltransferase family protein [Desulfovibrio sp.]|uniref:glycosyltransferase family protein n=1 Tax=Desulfovibrio sp. TaxID=885 RepID=UPI0023CEDB67|nr:glycosyltransferase family protein [Desulfovibrio sp.]MDE7242360.1 teichoic acid biosynthesis protein [Desulfovibrio sp.]